MARKYKIYGRKVRITGVISSETAKLLSQFINKSSDPNETTSSVMRKLVHNLVFKTQKPLEIQRIRTQPTNKTLRCGSCHSLQTMTHQFDEIYQCQTCLNFYLKMTGSNTYYIPKAEFRDRQQQRFNED